MTILELIKDLKLEQNRVVDLTQISSEMHYYSDFDSALSDINNGVYSDNSTVEDAVIATFGTEDIFIMRMLADIDLSDKEIKFDNNIIFDLNGYTLKLGNGKMILSEDSGQIDEATSQTLSKNSWSFLFYGMEKGSCISVNRTIDISNVFESFYGTQFTGIIGGNYFYSLKNETETTPKAMATYQLFGMTTIICNCNFVDKDIRVNEYTDTRTTRYLIHTIGNTYIKNSNATLDIQEADDKCHITGRCVYCNSCIANGGNLIIENCNLTTYNINSNYVHRGLHTNNYKTKITNSNIQQISVKGTWFATETEQSTGARFYGNKQTTYIENSYIYGEHSGFVAPMGKTYVVNSRLVGTSHGGAYCSASKDPEAVFYFKNCEFDCVKDSTFTGGYTLGSIFIGYGATVYADNCTFDTWLNDTICFNQRDESLKSSTLYMSNCNCKKNIRGTSTTTGNGYDYTIKYSTLVVGENNTIPNLEALKSASGKEAGNLYVEEQLEAYYGDKPDFTKDFIDSTAIYLEKLDIERRNLYNVCRELKCADVRNTKLSGLVNTINPEDIYNTSKLELLQDSEYMSANVSGTVIAINDISPIEHSVGCRVASKNLFNAFDTKNSEENNAFDTFEQSEGCVTVTSDNSTASSVSFSLLNVYLQKGNYILSFDIECENSVVSSGTVDCIYVWHNDVLKTVRSLKNDGQNGSIVYKFTLTETTKVKISWYKNVTSYTPNNTIYKAVLSNIQLEIGTTATEYTPYISDFTKTNSGKNLCSNKYKDYADTVYKSLYIANEPLIMSLKDKDTSIDVSGCYFGFAVNPDNINDGYRWVINNGTVQSSKHNAAAQNEALCPYLIMYPETEETFNKIMQRWYIQVEKGTKATSYVPYIDSFSPIEISKYGKNLFDKNLASLLDNWTDVGSGYFTFPIFVGKNSTVTVSYQQDLVINMDCPYTSIIFDAINNKEGEFIYHKTLEGFIKKTVTGIAADDYIYVRATVYYTLSEFMQYIGNDLQIEISPIATTYEPYIEPTTYTAKADGTVEGIKSIPPNMTLISNNDGAIINAHYYKDIDKALQEKQDEGYNSAVKEGTITILENTKQLKIEGLSKAPRIFVMFTTSYKIPQTETQTENWIRGLEYFRDGYTQGNSTKVRIGNIWYTSNSGANAFSTTMMEDDYKSLISFENGIFTIQMLSSDSGKTYDCYYGQNYTYKWIATF